MFGILTWPIRITFTAICLYGLAHIPVQEEPLWKHVQAAVVQQWNSATQFVSNKKAKVAHKKDRLLDKAKRLWADDPRAKRMIKKRLMKKRLPKKKRLVGVKQSKRPQKKSVPREQIHHSEQKKLEDILDREAR